MNWVDRRRAYRDAGRHRLARRRLRTIELVDARTLQAHLLTDEAFAAARRTAGRYVALCGSDVLPASLTVGERGRCRSCVSAPVAMS